ncbi:MAG: DedA family protein [Candidatus Gracilibacteria bacterium]|nr:DedA family protein [Candidatus Gracilibacteria bacterium]MDD2908968.1 DedA family protein [Candidatus Gracilibacteria bacterium]
MLDFFLSYLLIYTYPVLFLITLASSFLIPFPANAMIIAAGAFAAQGYLDFNIVLITSFFGCLSGDIIGYLISFFYGKNILMRIGFSKIINSPKFEKLEIYFKNNSIKSILLTRFVITGLSAPVNILAGLSKIGHKKYFIYNVSGEIIHIVIFVGTGYYLSNEWQNIVTILEYFVILLVIIVIVFLFFRFMNSNKQNKILK